MTCEFPHTSMFGIHIRVPLEFFLLSYSLIHRIFSNDFFTISNPFFFQILCFCYDAIKQLHVDWYEHDIPIVCFFIPLFLESCEPKRPLSIFFVSGLLFCHSHAKSTNVKLYALSEMTTSVSYQVTILCMFRCWKRERLTLLALLQGRRK